MHLNNDEIPILTRLQNWYTGMCDGGWEHFFGVKVDTLDNPGWRVEIDIIDTPLEKKPFEPIHIYKSDDDFFHCVTENGKFKGAGDAAKLEEILHVFLNWAEYDKGES